MSNPMNFTAKGDAEKLAITSTVAIFLAGVIWLMPSDIQLVWYFFKILSIASLSLAVGTALLSTIKAVQIPKE